MSGSNKIPDKILIIPDIHTKFTVAESIIDQESPDKVVFLGDYFDSFDDSLEITAQVAEWLHNSMQKKDRIHLLGNHDLAYMDARFFCTGFSDAKLFVIKKTDLDLTKLEHYCWVDEWLCTHSGLTYEFYKAFAQSGMSVNDLLETYVKDDKVRFRLYSCSPFRGGMDAHSGIVWCDYNEFVDIPDVKQIFGHTRGDEVRTNGQHICLDTGLNNYAVYEDNRMKIKGLTRR